MQLSLLLLQAWSGWSPVPTGAQTTTQGEPVLRCVRNVQRPVLCEETADTGAWEGPWGLTLGHDPGQAS